MDDTQLNIDEVAAEMAADPLSKALFELAQYRVLVRRQSARITDLTRELAGRGPQPTQEPTNA